VVLVIGLAGDMMIDDRGSTCSFLNDLMGLGTAAYRMGIIRFIGRYNLVTVRYELVLHAQNWVQRTLWVVTKED